MARTNATVVEALLGDNYDGETSLQQFIDSATVVVSRVASMAMAKISPVSLSSTELEIIERWLACHLYCQYDLLYQSKSTEGASASFQGQTGMGLESTRYGQTAMNLDVSGSLIVLNKRQFAGALWLGKPPSEQIDYRDRS